MIDRRILITILTLGMFAAVATAGTYAYFSDSQVTGTATITAGVLKLNDLSKIMCVVKDAYPGDKNLQIGEGFEILSTGNRAGTLTAEIIKPDDVKGFSEYLTVVAVDDTAGVKQVIYDKGVASKPMVLSDNLKPGESHKIRLMYFYANDEAVSQVQGGAFNFAVQFVLKQNV